MIELLGIAGGVCFALSGIPSAWNALTQKVSYVPVLTSWCVLTGAILMMLYLFLKNGFDWVVFLDYFVTIVSWVVILWFTYFPKKEFDYGS